MVSNINICRSFSMITHSWAVLPFRNYCYFQIVVSLAFLYLLSHKFSGCIFQFLCAPSPPFPFQSVSRLAAFSSLLPALLRFPSVFNLFCIHFATFWAAFVIMSRNRNWQLVSWKMGQPRNCGDISLMDLKQQQQKRQTISSII